MTVVPVASIKIVGMPSDGLWHIGVTYHLRIEEFSATGALITPPHAEKEPYLNPNWNCPDGYGLMTPILDTAGTGDWRADYVPSAAGSDPIAATVTAANHIFQAIIDTNNTP